MHVIVRASHASFTPTVFPGFIFTNTTASFGSAVFENMRMHGVLRHTPANEDCIGKGRSFIDLLHPAPRTGRQKKQGLKEGAPSLSKNFWEDDVMW